MKEEKLLLKLSKEDSFFANEIYISYLQKSLSTNKKIDYIFKFIISIIISYLLILINIIFSKKILPDKEVGIGRVEVESNKIKKFNPKIQIISDNIKNKDFTIYRIGSRTQRIIFSTFYYWKNCINEYNQLKKIILNLELEIYKKDILSTYLIRIPHSVVFEFAINELLKNYSRKNIYIGSMYERFSLIVEKKSKKYGKKIICIPHGIEFIDKLPKGFIGDVIFCSSKKTRDNLSRIYEKDSFYYNFKLNKRLYSYRQKKMTEVKKVVYFTQPIEVEKNVELIKEISYFLKSIEKKLYIKVHPNDDSKKYILENVEEIERIEEAIYNNYCISYNSTILIEALYNNSISITNIFLINSKIELQGNLDFLNEEKILKPKTIEELLQIIK